MIFRRFSLVDPATGVTVQATLNADGQTPLVDVRARLARLAPVPGELFLNSRPFPTTGALKDLDLADGSMVGCGKAVAPLRINRASSGLELRVVGGPFAGTVFPLTEGTHTLGRGDVDLRLPSTDMFLGRRHLNLVVQTGKVRIEDLGSSNVTIVEGEELTEPKALDHGVVFQAGNSLLAIYPTAAPELTLVDLGAGALGLNRKFRSGLPELPAQVQFPAKPMESERPKLNLLVTLAPVLGGVLMAMLINPFYLIFAIVGPIVGLVSSASRRRSWDKKRVQDRREFEEATTKAVQELRRLRIQEVRQQREISIDPAAALQSARAAGRSLWCRRGQDPDLLVLRVGSAGLPSRISESSETEAPGELWMAPLTVDLCELGGVALTGDLDRARDLARSLLLQATVLHSPAELRVVVLADEDSERQWGWVRWLPHARWATDEPFVLIGSDPVSTAGRVLELQELVKRRKQERVKKKSDRFLPQVIVVYDTTSDHLGDGVAEVMRDGPSVGVYTISIDDALIPEGCNGSVALEHAMDQAVVERAGKPTKGAVLVDGVSPTVCDLAARCMAPLQVIGEKGAQELPGSLRLLELLGLQKPDAQSVSRRWAANSRRPDAAVGISTNGTVMLDLTRDGPHGVIAGMSRSGKSEFLKTLIASLAANNHPDDLSFLFIDFKGGNDYQLVATLPHAVDLSTQTDTSGFERALRLLDAEIIRRQRIAGRLKTSTLEGYWAEQAKRSESTEKLGRLIVIVDEFAELAQKQPEQLDRLVSVTRVGAAYGVHLLLATQRPSGVVSGQIDANAPLRVCFRTASADQSIDIMGTPDAASIAERHRGRGFKRAHQEPPVEFQCARVGNARPGAASREPLEVSVSHFATLGHLPRAKQSIGEVADPDTDLHDLVQAIQDAAAAGGWTTNAVPWPKPLPEKVRMSRLARMSAKSSRLEIPFALRDEPERQAHIAAPIVLGAGHVAIAGSASTGRSTALRSFAIGVASALPCDQAHVFGLDFAGGGLDALSKLPHCSGVASSDQELVSRILDHLESQIRQRKEAFGKVGAAGLIEYNGHHGTTDGLPWLVLVVDGWEIVHEEAQRTAGAQIHDRILRLLGEGQRFGLHAVVAGDRWVASGRAGRQFSHQFLLRFNSPSDYDTLGVPSSKVPAEMPPGRALHAGLVHQIGILGDGTGSGSADSFDRIAAKVTSRDSGVPAARRPKRLAKLLSSVELGSLLASASAPQGSGIPVLVGLTADSSEALWIDLGAEAPGFLVAGPRRKGRSTALEAFARSALTAGVEVVALTPRKSPLTSLAGYEGVLGVLGPEEAATADIAGLCSGRRVLLIVDDADQIDPFHPVLNQIAQQLRTGLCLVVAGTPDFLRNQAGFVGAVRRHKSGLLLCPDSPYDGSLLGSGNLDRTMLFSDPPGRGWLGFAGEIQLIQVPKSH